MEPTKESSGTGPVQSLGSEGLTDAPAVQTNFDRAKLQLLYTASKALASTTDLDKLLNIIVREVRRVLSCEGTAVVLYDEEEDEFYWRSVQDTRSLLAAAKENIRIPKDRGVAGWVFTTGRPALIHDAANDPRIYRAVEDKSGFTTRNMICVPLNGRDKRLGVLYALNKVEESFSEEDVDLLSALSGNIGLALQNASNYDELICSHRELERLNGIKSRILNHLSHELRTPLAIIEASLRIIHRRLEEGETQTERFPFERIYRNLERLKTIEKQVGHIVEERDESDQKTLSRILGHLRDLLELEQEEQPLLTDAMEAIRSKLKELFPTRSDETEEVSVAAVFQAARFRIEQRASHRPLDIAFHDPDPAIIKVQPQILLSSLNGLIRNAIENTPDHGRIVIRGKWNPLGYIISVIDFGVGIPESETANVFEGFCPVAETDMYSSGQRYSFNAGGTGTDLLKIKIFSERCGFKVRFDSRRCSCIPTSRDICPGDPAKCVCCENTLDCLENGGTEFSLKFPPHMVKRIEEHPVQSDAAKPETTAETERLDGRDSH